MGSRETSARNQYHSANNACNRAKGARVQVGAKSLSQFKVGCAAFLNDGKYIAAKRHMSKTCNDATKKEAAHANSKKATASALKAHQKAKKDCACRAQKNHKNAVKAAANFNSSANSKAWTKAHHMPCVLDGKAANKCKVPRVPRVTTPSMPSWVARTKCSAPAKPLHCKMTAKGSNHAGVIKPTFPGGGYQLVGGGMNNHYRSFNKKAHFERSHPNGNGWIGDMGYGWGDYTVSTRSCTGVACTTKHSGVGNSKVVTCPKGYKVTACGSHQMNGWGQLGAFEQMNFHGNGCHCDMGFGSGKQRCYARCCK